MEKLNTTCIMCPMGCNLEIKNIDGEIIVAGNTCKRGAEYGKQEFLQPKRVVTTLFKCNGKVCSCKTSALVDKNKIADILKEVAKINYKGAVQIGDVIIKNVLNLGADIVATKNME
ncbi:MAG: DUF1667 domain-containing protein, partial [Clostridia bacterium]